MEVRKNIIVVGTGGKPMLVDIFVNASGKLKPVVIYAHGFNGFKDWGNFDIIASQFAESGFVFIKFNFSHNGTTPEHPEDFVDLDAYGNNNYTKELEDLDKIITWVTGNENPYSGQINKEQLYLTGHSMGGGLVILKAAEDKRVKRLATWAAISECKTPWTNWSSDRIQAWREKGVEYNVNSRTKQNLPLYFQLYENYKINVNRLNIEAAIRSLSIPVLLCHGTLDEGVPMEQAKDLNTWQPAAELFLVNSDHVFGRKHPWTAKGLPEPMQQVINRTIEFFARE